MTTPNFEIVHEEIARLCRLARDNPSRRENAEAEVQAIGKALAALAGFEALYAAFDFVEINVGQHEAVWLSRRWSGVVSDGNGSTWG